MQRILVTLAFLASLILTPTSAKALGGGGLDRLLGRNKPAAAPANPNTTVNVSAPPGTTAAVNVTGSQPAAQPATTPPTPAATPATAGTPAGAPAKVAADTTKPPAKAKGNGGGNTARRAAPSNLEPIVLDWTDKFQCVAYGTGYPSSVRPDISLDPGMQPKEPICLGLKAKIITRQNLGQNKIGMDGEVELARDVDPVLSLSAAANGFSAEFVREQSKKAGRELSQQEVQDRLDCMRAAKAWGISSGKVQYARTGVSAHTMGASRNDKRFTQAGNAAPGAVGAWCLDKDEVWSLEDARALASRDGGSKKIKALEIKYNNLKKRVDDLEANQDRINGKIAGHDAVLVNHEARIQELERRKNWFAVGATVEMTARRPGNIPFGVQLGWMGERLGGKLFFAAHLNLLFMKEQYQLDRVKLPTSALSVGGIVTVAKKWNNGFVFGGSAAGLISQSVSFEDGHTATHGTVNAFLGAGPAIGVVGKRFYGLLSVPVGWEWEMVPVVKDGRTLLPVAGGFGVLPNLGIGAKF